MTTKILLVDDFEPWRRSVRLILESNPSFRVISTGVNDNKSCLPHRAPIGEISTGIFASSNDESSIIMWSSSGQNWTDLEAMSILRYDPSLGVANGGDSVVLGDRLFLAVGDANGFVSFWSGDEYGTNLELYQTVDVRNPKPTNAWGLHNIRGISTMFSSGSAGYGERVRGWIHIRVECARWESYVPERFHDWAQCPPAPPIFVFWQ